MTSDDSQELLRRHEAGDDQAAGEIFDRYVARLLALARGRMSQKLRRRVDPEDVVQSAYRSFFVHAGREEFQLRQAGDLWRLLASITLNKLRGQVERQSAARRAIARDDAFVGSAAELPARPEPSPVEVIAMIEILELVSARLEGREREIVVAHLRGEAPEEVAARLGVSARTVERAVQDFRKALEAGLATPTHARSPRVAPPPNTGTLETWLDFADFTLHRLVAAGGMGKVYQATRRSTGETVALKSLHKVRQASATAVGRFLQEAAVLARLDHPGIVRLHGVGQYPGGGYFLVMDFVDGRDLQAQLRDGPFGEGEAVRIVRDVALAVEHAHACGVVHGDLKPGNVLMKPDGTVVVTDFGLAHLAADQHGPRPQVRSVGGTHGYLAPELLKPRATPTPASDVYALGALLWTLATGVTPRDKGDVQSGEQASQSLADVCARCLGAVPGARFHSAAELAERLAAWDMGSGRD